jgi:DNA-binding transcriptional regulator YiaG
VTSKTKREKPSRRPPRRGQSASGAREALGVSQRELSQLLGVSQSTIWRWEAGERDPGALGEVLFALIADSPTRARRVLQRLRAERKRGPTRRRSESSALTLTTPEPGASSKSSKLPAGLPDWPLLREKALTTTQLHELFEETATAIGSRDPARLWRRLRRKMESQGFNYEEFKILLAWRPESAPEGRRTGRR